MTEAPVGRVGHLGDALVADRGVGWDQRPRPGHRSTLDDADAANIGGRGRCPRHGLDPGKRWCLGDQPPGELVDACSRPRHLDEHPSGVVAHDPVEPGLDRESVHERPEPDALHDAAHLDALGTGAGDRHVPIVAAPGRIGRTPTHVRIRARG